MKILVVDDNEDGAMMLGDVLTARGHETFVALDGLNALKLAETHVPDIALLDLGLPGMDGFELARRLRTIPALAAIKLVALTGYGQDSDRQKTRDAGFDHHLVKPVTIATIEKILG